MRSVFVAGATGYLGRHICREFSRRGWYVTALVRNAARAGDLDADTVVEAEATRGGTLKGAMEGADLVVSALGITRQAEGLDYRDVDYGANLNLLAEARRAGVSRFAYVHVLNAERMAEVPLVAAKADFVAALQSSDMASTIVSPSGFFSDMQAFFDMARAGRAWLFGSGKARINPIHGADLARALADAVEAGRDRIDVGGPETFTQTEIAALAFAALGKPARITRLPDTLRRAALVLLPRVTPRKVHGPAQFFLTAMAMDMVGTPTGSRSLAKHFSDLAAKG